MCLPLPTILPRLTIISFNLADVGMKGKSVLYDPLHQTVQVMNDNDEFQSDIPGEKFAYYIVAPVTSAGIAFLGDAGKITATGKKRIAGLTASANTLQVNVLFAKGDGPVTLNGYSEKKVTAGKLKVSQNASSHLFTVVVPPPANGGLVMVTMQTK